MEVVKFSVPSACPIAFGQALQYLRTSPARIVERIGDHTYHRPLTILGRPVVLGVSADGEVVDRLDVELRGERLGEGSENIARATVERMFATNVNLDPLYSGHIGADELGEELLSRFRGVRPVLLPDLFETITWAIIGQQINVQFAAKCKRAFVDRFGTTFTLDGEEWQLFPTPERVTEISEPELAAIQFSRQKSRYVLNLAREIVDGELDLAGLYKLPAQDALERLERLTGIGRWTAEYVLMRGIGHSDVIPAADGGLRRIIGQRYGFDRLASETEVRAIAEKWSGWRSYFAFYLWFTLQEEERVRREVRAEKASA